MNINRLDCFKTYDVRGEIGVNFDAKIVLTETFRSENPIELEQGGYFCNFREKSLA